MATSAALTNSESHPTTSSSPRHICLTKPCTFCAILAGQEIPVPLDLRDNIERLVPKAKRNAAERILGLIIQLRQTQLTGIELLMQGMVKKERQEDRGHNSSQKPTPPVERRLTLAFSHNTKTKKRA